MFHDTNDKDESRGARLEIAKVLHWLQTFFPRPDNTNGYNIPKMHGMTKFVEYMILYWSAINFYGGPGEANHKIFVKAAGQILKGEYVSLLSRLHISIII
jgi:hypothetical protein